MTDTSEVLLHHHLKKLRLPTFLTEYGKQTRQCAAENKDHAQYLLRLCEFELIERERRMIERHIKAAKFPAAKSLDSFGFKVIASLNKPLTMELACCEFVDKQDNVIALGPSGTGKPHVALGLGLAACQKGLKVRFTTAAAPVHELIEAASLARREGRWGGTTGYVDVTDRQAPLAARGLIDVAYGANHYVPLWSAYLMLSLPSKVRLAAFVCRAPTLCKRLRGQLTLCAAGSYSPRPHLTTSTDRLVCEAR